MAQNSKWTISQLLRRNEQAQALGQKGFTKEQISGAMEGAIGADLMAGIERDKLSMAKKESEENRKVTMAGQQMNYDLGTRKLEMLEDELKQKQQAQSVQGIAGLALTGIGALDKGMTLYDKGTQWYNNNFGQSQTPDLNVPPVTSADNAIKSTVDSISGTSDTLGPLSGVKSYDEATKGIDYSQDLLGQITSTNTTDTVGSALSSTSSLADIGSTISDAVGIAKDYVPAAGIGLELATGDMAGAASAATQLMVAEIPVIGAPLVAMNTLFKMFGGEDYVSNFFSSVGLDTSGGLSVICSVMHKNNWISDDVKYLDTLYGHLIDIKIYLGYLFLFSPIAKFADNHKWFAWLIRPIAVPTANAIANKVKPDGKSHIFGNIILKLGSKLSKSVWR